MFRRLVDAWLKTYVQSGRPCTFIAERFTWRHAECCFAVFQSTLAKLSGSSTYWTWDVATNRMHPFSKRRMSVEHIMVRTLRPAREYKSLLIL
jgi:hypothetical protein